MKINRDFPLSLKKHRSVEIWIKVYIRKKGKLDTSHRYDLLPLLRSSPGGIQRELVVYDLPGTKVIIFSLTQKFNAIFGIKGI